MEIASPNISAAVAASTKDPQVAQATSINLKSIGRWKVLYLTDMNGNELGITVMWFEFKQGYVTKWAAQNEI